MKKKIIYISLGVIAAVLLAVYVITPRIIKSYIVNNSYDFVGRKITIGKLSGNVFTGRYQFNDVVVFEPDETNMFVCFDTIVLKTSLLKLLSKKVNFDEMTFVNMTVNIEQDKNSFNFSDIVEFLNKKEPDTEKIEKQYESQPSPHVILNNITLKNCKINYFDKTVSQTWSSGNISLNIPGINFGREDKTNLGLTLNLEDGGLLTTNLIYDVLAKRYALKFDVEALNLAQILPYIQRKLKISDISGIADLRIVVSGDAEHILDSKISGNLKLKNVHLKNENKEPLGFVDSLKLDVNAINFGSNNYWVNHVDVDGLNVFFELNEKGSNFGNILADTNKIDWFEKIKLKVNRLQVRNSSVNYADNTLDDDFKFAIENVKIDANNFSFTEFNTINIDADFPSGGRIVAHWNGSFADTENQSFAASLNNLNMNELSPYSLRYLGYPITGGTISINIRNRIANKNIDGLIDVDIYKAQLEKKSKKAKPLYDMPLRTALYVMKDKNDKISLQIPISGNVDSPEFSYKKIITKSISKYLGRVATSPFSFMSKASNPDEILFNMATVDFAPDQFAKIREIAETAAVKPEMKLHFKQYFNYKKYQQYFEAGNGGNTIAAIVKTNEVAARYNNRLVEYLKQNRLKESSFEVSTADELELQRYTGESKYRITAEFADLEK